MDKVNAHSELELLRNLFVSANDFCKNTLLNSQNKTTVNDLPWFLLVGASAAGKTSFITRSKLSLLNAPHLATLPQDESEQHKRCNWWFSQQGIFLDVPGEYWYADKQHQIINWSQFLTELNNYQRSKPCSGIIFSLNIAEWARLDKSEQKNFIKIVRHNLTLLSKLFKIACPFYLVLTHVDQIAGFNEFFTDLGQEERSQKWGIDFSDLSVNSNLTNIFKARFQQLLKRLHDRVIWRLQQERNLSKRNLIQNFPLQLETLKTSLAEFIYQLADLLRMDYAMPLQGIYFTSNLQQGTPIDCLQKHFNQTALSVNQNAPTIPLLIHSTQAYFNEKLLAAIIHKKLANSAFRTSFTQRKQTQIIAWSLAGLCMISSGAVFAERLHVKLKQINIAQTALNEYHLMTPQLISNPRDLLQTLPALDLLQQATDALQQADLPWPFNHLNSAASAKTVANQTYQQALNRYFIAGISNQLEQTLATSTDPEVQYGALKTYLMLQQPNHFDLLFLQRWLSHYWQQTYANNPQLENKLQSHLQKLSADNLTAIAVNQNLVNKVRASLTNRPTSQLAYAIIKNQMYPSPIKLFSDNNADIIDKVFITNNSNIPALFSAQQFQDVYFEQIKNASLAATHGNWVLGSVATDNDSLDNVIVRVQDIYLQEYANRWQTLLSNLPLQRWQTWQQANDALNALVNRHSPLIDLLKTIQANTALPKLIPAPNNILPDDLQKIKTQLADRFATINGLFVNNDKNSTSSIDALLTNLTQLQDYLKTIKNDDKAAFNIAKQRFNNTTNDDALSNLLKLSNNINVPFIQNWLKQLADNSWGLILQQTRNHINNDWQTNVLSFYNEKLNNRYPFFKSAQSTVAIDDFKQFFGNEGLLQNFTKSDLAAFIDTTQAQWQWRTVDGQTINLSNELLAQLERANIIRGMFFNNKNELSVKFSLRNLQMEPNVVSFSFALNGQSFTDHQDDEDIHLLNWPNLNGTQNTHFVFVDNQGHKVEQYADGSWGLFRILNKINLHPTDNTQHFELTFDANGNAARYQLASTQLINPFIPQIIDHFRCPENLLS